MYHGAVVIMSQFCLRKKSRVRSSTTSPIPWTKDVTVFWIGLLGCAHAASNGPTPCAMFFCILATSCVIFAIHVTCNIPIYSRCWSSFALISPIFLCFSWISPCLDPSSHHPMPPGPPGIISERQAFAGFASPGVAAYAALFILSEAFAEVKVLDAVMPRAKAHHARIWGYSWGYSWGWQMKIPMVFWGWDW